MQVLDPLTDLYSHKKRPGMLTNAMKKTTAPSAPVMGLDELPQGYEEGGMLAGPIDWAKRNIVQPVQTFVSNLSTSAPAATNPPPAATQVGSGYLHNTAVTTDAHKKALEEAGSGYAQGGMISGIADWTNRNIIQPISNIHIPGVTGVPGGGVVNPPIANTPAAPSAPLQPSNLGSGYAYGAATAAQQHERDLKAAGGFAEGGMVDDPLKKVPVVGQPAYPGAPVMDYTPSSASGVVGDPTPKTATIPSWGGVNRQDVLASLPPHGAEGGWDAAAAAPVVKPITTAPAVPSSTAATPVIAPPAVVATDPPTAVDSTGGSGFAQVGKKKIGLENIGVKGQDPLAAMPVATNQQVATSPEFAGLRHNEAMDRDKAHADAVYKQQVADAVKANLVDGHAPSLDQIKTLGLSPADVNAMLAANNKGGRFDKTISANIASQQAALTAQQTGAEIGLKKSETELAQARAGVLQGGGPVKKGGLTPDGRQVFYNGKGQQLVYGPDGEPEPYSGKVTSGSGMGRMYQILNKETGQFEQVSQSEKEASPDKYGASSSDPKAKAWVKNEQYHTANANFVNTIGAFGKQAAEIMQKYNLNNDPKLVNYTIQQLIQSKGMGAGDVAALNNILMGYRGEMSKMAEGSLGVAGAHVETAKKYGNSISDSMPLKDFLTMSQWADREGKARLDSIQKESDRLEKELGIKGTTAAAPAAASNNSPVAGARQAPDGKWYVSDPARPGKYLEVRP